MDCETFERVVLDRVFQELDELTMGSAQRHVAHCSRCRTIEVSLRATRDVCRLPLLLPMEGFAECVLTQEKQLHSVLPVRQRLNRTVSMLASYAMRPQPTMAVLLLLMIGASLFLVRTHPAARDLVRVTERGIPEADQEPSVNKNGVNPSTWGATANSGPTEVSGRALDSENLDQARAMRRSSGCSAALQAFEEIRRKQSSSEAGLDATWEAAECYVDVNRKSDAQELFKLLASSAKYGRRARAQLEAMGDN